ncbi:MAG: glycosyltransferase [bacterium]|nr:glycosyltransferase [bacterium]
MKISLGIFAYNEEKNVAKLLGAVLGQKLNKVELEEIIVVASGCTDKTVEISRGFSAKDGRVRVLVQEKREGKFSAINLFLKTAKNEILAIESADTLPSEDVLERLIKPFEDSLVGMAGARPMPTNNESGFWGFASHFLWELHHQLSLAEPKMGELVAFRKIFDKIPPTAVDEAVIEAIISSAGFKVVYVPDAIVYNKGPESLFDFLKQRRRIFCGHLALRKQLGHKVSTMDWQKIFALIFKNLKPSIRFLAFVSLIVLLEALARFLGWLDYCLGRNHYIWQNIESAKNPAVVIK